MCDSVAAQLVGHQTHGLLSLPLHRKNLDVEGSGIDEYASGIVPRGELT